MRFWEELLVMGQAPSSAAEPAVGFTRSPQDRFYGHYRWLSAECCEAKAWSAVIQKSDGCVGERRSPDGSQASLCGRARLVGVSSIIVADVVGCWLINRHKGGARRAGGWRGRPAIQDQRCKVSSQAGNPNHVQLRGQPRKVLL